MKFLTVVGGLVALASQIFVLFDFQWPLGRWVGVYNPVYAIIGIIISVITIYTAINPDNPFPFHWLFLFVLGVLIVIFAGGIVACALIIIAALIGLIDVL